MFSELGPSLISYGDLVAEEIQAWIDAHVDRGLPLPGEVPDESLVFDEEMKSVLGISARCTT